VASCGEGLEGPRGTRPAELPTGDATGIATRSNATQVPRSTLPAGEALVNLGSCDLDGQVSKTPASVVVQ
jgi:hypothetical protein